MKARFEVNAVVPYKDGVGLMGRCTAGLIKLGDVFVLALKRHVIPDDSNSFVVHKERIADIHLEVQEIQYFNREVPELQEYHSGGLYVIGIGAEFLGPDCEIESEQESVG